MTPSTPTDGEAQAFRDLVIWARKSGVILGSLSVGSIQAHLSDPHAMRLPDPQPGDAMSAIREYGGPSLANAIENLVPVDRGES